MIVVYDLANKVISMSNKKALEVTLRLFILSNRQSYEFNIIVFSKVTYLLCKLRIYYAEIIQLS